MLAGVDEAEIGLGSVGSEGDKGSQGADGGRLGDGDGEGCECVSLVIGCCGGGEAYCRRRCS